MILAWRISVNERVLILMNMVNFEDRKMQLSNRDLKKKQHTLGNPKWPEEIYNSYKFPFVQEGYVHFPHR
jgi:hypothetical protein